MTNQKKKILIFSIVYYPRLVGGAEVAVKEITDRQPESVAEFHMITLRSPNDLPVEEKIGNVIIHRILGGVPLRWGKLLFPFGAALKAHSLNKVNRFDLIWSIMANYAGFAALFFKYMHPKVNFLLTLQEGDPIPYIKRRARLVYPLFRRIFVKADHIQAISNYLADWAKEMGAKCPVIVVSNGVDLKIFGAQVSAERIAELRKELEIESDQRVLITTSRLVEKNAVGDIIGALQFLPHNVKLLILGNGPLENDLRKKTEDLKLLPRVLFLGYVPHEKMPNYLHSSDIFIRPSLSEGMGNSFIEAMAAGVPVIATNVGGIPDFLKDKETGLFCAVKDPKDIARKVTILLRDKEIRDYVVGNAKKLVVEKYDWDLVSTNMRTILSL